MIVVDEDRTSGRFSSSQALRRKGLEDRRPHRVIALVPVEREADGRRVRAAMPPMIRAMRFLLRMNLAAHGEVALELRGIGEQ